MQSQSYAMIQLQFILTQSQAAIIQDFCLYLTGAAATIARYRRKNITSCQQDVLATSWYNNL